MSYFDVARMVLALSDLLARSLHVVCRCIGKFYCKYPYDITAPHIINIASLEACEHMLVGSDVALCVYPSFMHALQCLYPSGVSALLRIPRFPARCFAHNHNSLTRGCVFLKFLPFLLRQILLEATKKKRKKKKEKRKILQHGSSPFA